MSVEYALKTLMKKHRNRKGITQKKLAEILEVDRVTIMRIESNRKPIVSIFMVEKIFRVLEIDWIEFANEIRKSK